MKIQICEVAYQLYLVPTVKVTHDIWLNGSYELIFSFLKWELVISK